MGEWLRPGAEAYADKTWLIFYSDADETRGIPGDRHTLTYKEFYSLVRRTAEFLLQQGVGRGDRIATVAYNHMDTVVQYFAAWLIGAVVVPINVGEDDKRIGYILENSGV